jgi:hypothetical protein
MSSRAIAPILGVSQSTAVRDLAQVIHRESPESAVAGLDGKTYRGSKTSAIVSEPEPSISEEQAERMVETFGRPVTELTRNVTTLMMLMTDDPAHQHLYIRYLPQLTKVETGVSKMRKALRATLDPNAPRLRMLTTPCETDANRADQWLNEIETAVHNLEPYIKEDGYVLLDVQLDRLRQLVARQANLSAPNTPIRRSG